MWSKEGFEHCSSPKRYRTFSVSLLDGRERFLSDLNIICLKLNSYRSDKISTAEEKRWEGVMLRGTGDTFSYVLALQKAGVSVSIFFYRQEGRQAGKKIKQSEE